MLGAAQEPGAAGDRCDATVPGGAEERDRAGQWSGGSAGSAASRIVDGPRPPCGEGYDRGMEILVLVIPERG